MVLVTTNVFDGGAAGGDGNRTQVIQQVDATTTRTTTMTYDFRDRMITTDGEIDYFSVTYYDNLDRVVQFDRYDTTGPGGPSSSSSSSGSMIGNLISRTQTVFDARGNICQSIVFSVDPATGIVGNALTDNTCLLYTS